MSPHGWLRLSEPYCVRDYVDHAKMRGVWICPAEDFVAGRAASPHAVRLCLGPVPSRKKLATALGTLAEILERPPAPLCSVV
jgi:DNA-binding transcriptional MocR family regulator